MVGVQNLEKLDRLTDPDRKTRPHNETNRTLSTMFKTKAPATKTAVKKTAPAKKAPARKAAAPKKIVRRTEEEVGRA